ncbi:MAG: SCO family protein [Acidobacteria bacterium]|nr:SCO family protein [Acidobacteriota bacterium]
MKSAICRGSFLVLLFCLLPAGCRDIPRVEYDLKGKVVDVNRDRGQVTLEHEEIPGYMDAMTMPFNVREDWALSALSPGQWVEATLVVLQDRSWIENIRISGSESIAGLTETLPLPEPGDIVPDFGLLNQDNRPIHLHQYRGLPLLLTFIYTRCPLPDYCPLMSGNFAAIHHKLKFLPQSDKTPHLLTISFDTNFDTPSVLREYAARYMRPVRFDQWEFATGSPEEIREITGYFGLVYREESDQIVHSLVTALIDADGVLVRLYHGNQWRPDEILKDLEIETEGQ